VRIGIDIQSIEEVKDSLTRFGARYVGRLFTVAELAGCDLASPFAPRQLAERFAAKEAVLKMLEPTDIVPEWKDIEVFSSPHGCQEIVLSASAAQLAASRGLGALSVSFSHGGGVATAVVVSDVDVNDNMVRS